MNDPIKLRSNNGGYFVTSQATYYPTFARIFIPKYATKRLEAKQVGSNGQDLLVPAIDKETSEERSLRRSRKNVKDLVFCNLFDQFVTLTIADDRQNLQRSKLKVVNWIKNEKRRKGKFQYIIVPEFHKDKKSLHFHGLFKDYKGETKQSFQANGSPVIEKGRKVYNFPSFTSGYNYVEPIDNSVGSIIKVGFYLQKYITKDMPMIFGKNRYWASYKLKRPIKVDNPEPWYEYVTPDRKYENDFGVLLEFDLGKHALVDMFIEANNK